MVPSTFFPQSFKSAPFRLLINHLRHLPVLKDLDMVWPLVFPDKMYDLIHCPKLRSQGGGGAPLTAVIQRTPELGSPLIVHFGPAPI